MPMHTTKRLMIIGGTVLAAGTLAAGAFASTAPKASVAGWAGGKGAVRSAQTGPSGQSVMVAARKLGVDFKGYSAGFRAQVEAVIAAAHNAGNARGAAKFAAFEGTFTSANSAYDASVASAPSSSCQARVSPSSGFSSKSSSRARG